MPDVCSGSLQTAIPSHGFVPMQVCYHLVCHPHVCCHASLPVLNLYTYRCFAFYTAAPIYTLLAFNLFATFCAACLCHALGSLLPTCNGHCFGTATTPLFAATADAYAFLHTACVGSTLGGFPFPHHFPPGCYSACRSGLLLPRLTYLQHCPSALRVILRAQVRLPPLR